MQHLLHFTNTLGTGPDGFNKIQRIDNEIYSRCNINRTVDTYRILDMSQSTYIAGGGIPRVVTTVLVEIISIN